MDLDALFEEVAGLLDAEGRPWALIGGLALAAYGIGRPTADMDVVVEGVRQDEIIARVEAAGFETLHRSRGYSNHRRGAARLDCVYVRDQTADAVLGEARWIDAAHRRCRVARPEHLAAMKILAMKNDPERMAGELVDLRALLRLPDVDRGMIAAQMSRHGFEALYEQIRPRE